MSNELKNRIEKMEKLMSSFRKFGASDTEPEGHWQAALVEAAAHGKLKIPEGIRGWELYSVSGSDAVAEKLTKKAMAICLWIIRNNMNGELNQAIKRHCWRIGWMG